jgi:hypothetical protein
MIDRRQSSHFPPVGDRTIAVREPRSLVRHSACSASWRFSDDPRELAALLTVDTDSFLADPRARQAVWEVFGV